MSASDRSTPTRWQRGSGLEFDRVATFVDAVFAIALTLLVLDLHLPHLHDPNSVSGFIRALGHILDDLVAFAIAFSVIGQNWINQHRFFSRLEAVDGRFLGLTVVYLACIVLVPFPTSILSTYSGNPMAFTFFAVVLSAVAATDSLLVVHSHAAGLMRQRWTPAEYSYAVKEALSPIVLFLGTIPLAFLIGPIWTLILWLPLSFLLRRLLEPGAGLLHRRSKAKSTGSGRRSDRHP